MSHAGFREWYGTFSFVGLVPLIGAMVCVTKNINSKETIIPVSIINNIVFAVLWGGITYLASHNLKYAAICYVAVSIFSALLQLCDFFIQKFYYKDREALLHSAQTVGCFYGLASGFVYAPVSGVINACFVGLPISSKMSCA